MTINYNKYLPDINLYATNRIMGIDILRCVAAFLVVAIHFSGHPQISSINDWISHICTAEARIAVPIFFMITGYFYPYLIDSKRLPYQLKKLLFLAIGATFFYIVCELIGAYISGSFTKHVNLIFSYKTLLKLLIFNITPGAGHLWFFYSMIYALLLVAFFDKIHQKRKLNIIAVVLFLLLLASNFTPYFLYTRNYLFLGIPFILIGRSFSEGKLKEIHHSLTSSMCYMIIVSCIVLIAFELYMYYYLMPSMLPQRECFIFSAPEAIAIFAIALRINGTNHTKLKNYMALIGRKYSAYIFVFQYFAAGMGNIYGIIFTTTWIKLLLGNPIVYFLSLIISMIYLKLKAFVIYFTSETFKEKK